MNIQRPSLKLLIAFVALGLVGPVGLSFAARKKPAEQYPSKVSLKDHKATPETAPKALPAKVMKGAQVSLAEAKLGIVRKPLAMPVEVSPKKSHRAIKVSKKVAPKAVVQPRTDLMYYGILEDSQRYDPRPNPHLAGVPSPQTADLTHDHFQELDRNQDGKIDPVERVFGRIDMDRDLHTRQLQ